VAAVILVVARFRVVPTMAPTSGVAPADFSFLRFRDGLAPLMTALCAPAYRLVKTSFRFELELIIC